MCVERLASALQRTAAGGAVDVDLEVESVRSELTTTRSDMFDAEERFLSDYNDIPDAHRGSARNLVHYLALRKRDLRLLQDQLAALGLSSLGRAESQALANVQAVLDLVRQMSALTPNGSQRNSGFGTGRASRETHARELLGPAPDGRAVRIMVTMPGEAADDVNLVRDLLMSGMDCMRINTAHDDADTWDRIIANLERAKKSTNKSCRILMDLGGPKLRTGSIDAGPHVVHWRPKRDVMGHVVHPARIWLTPHERLHQPAEAADAVLPVAAEWLASLAAGDTIKLFDARDSMRTMHVVGCTDAGVWAESEQSAYVVPGTTLQLAHDGVRVARRAGRSTTVGDLPA